MKMTQRGYAEDAGDFGRLCHFIRAQHDHLRAHSTWCLGRLVDWKYGLYGNKMAVAAFCDQNALLWFDGFGDLAGCTISENGDGGFAIITAEGYDWLFEDILEKALGKWGRRRPGPSIEITEHQTTAAAVLERAGFGPVATFSSRGFDLTAPPVLRAPLESGYAIVDMATQPDYRAQRILRAEAFGGKVSLTEEELRRDLEFCSYLHAGPIYHPDCDLCVKAADGRFVAGCEALIDARNLTADIERVCTHSSFRRRGFARVVIQECMARLRAMGMRRAYIAGYSPEAIALYGSLGHSSEQMRFVYVPAPADRPPPA